MSPSQEAQKSILGLNVKDLGCRAITVNVARPRKERSGGGCGGRRHHGGGRDRY